MQTTHPDTKIDTTSKIDLDIHVEFWKREYPEFQNNIKPDYANSKVTITLTLDPDDVGRYLNRLSRA